MSNQRASKGCDCCDSSISRRSFLKSSSAAAATVLLPFGSVVEAADRLRPASGKSSETLVGELYKSLNEQQRGAICLPFGHELQSKIDNAWYINKSRVKEFSKDQQDLIRQIFLGLHSEEYAKAVWEATVHDNGEDGFGGCSIAMFGEPGKKFEFVLTGRHVTRRCDGDSVAGAAFGGPIFYGHQAGEKDEEPANHPGNAYWYQAKRANEVFQALDGKQRNVALLERSRPERKEATVALKGKVAGLEGIRVGELSSDQKDLVRKVMADVLAPFRKVDAEESMKLVEKSGFDDLHMAFFKAQDLGNDGVWDVWQIEGPNMVWYFRGDPHVHTWVNIREGA